MLFILYHTRGHGFSEVAENFQNANALSTYLFQWNCSEHLTSKSLNFEDKFSHQSFSFSYICGQYLRNITLSFTILCHQIPVRNKHLLFFLKFPFTLNTATHVHDRFIWLISVQLLHQTKTFAQSFFNQSCKILTMLNSDL